MLLPDKAVLLRLESLKHNLFFMLWVLFWNVGRIYFLVFCTQIIKSNRKIILLKYFPIIFIWWVIYSFLSMVIYKRFNFWYSFRFFSIFFHGLMRLLQRVEDIYYHFYWKDLLHLFWFLSNPHLVCDIVATSHLGLL